MTSYTISIYEDIMATVCATQRW